ncbi:hypothetical protein [Hoylesella timonensis]|nr:hypothetical protein [Hoylesella timonensis]
MSLEMLAADVIYERTTPLVETVVDVLVMDILHFPLFFRADSTGRL